MKKYQRVLAGIGIFLFLFTVSITPNIELHSVVHAQIATTELESVPQIRETIWQKIGKAISKAYKQVLNQTVNNTVRSWANNFAYEVANSIVTGAEGGKPLFRTDSIKNALRKSEEAAIGEFIGDLSERHFADLGLNLCDPSIEVKLTLTLGLIDSKAPPAPKCNWQEIQQNWSQFSSQVKDGRWQDFIKISLNTNTRNKETWNDFWSQFDPGRSDLDIAFKVLTEAQEREQRAAEVSKITSAECQGYRDKQTVITQEVKTHCAQILKISEIQFDLANSTDQGFMFGYEKEDSTLKLVLKEAGNMFMQTLSSKLLKLYIDKGIRQIASWYDEDTSFRASLLDKLRGGVDLRRPPAGADVFRDLQTLSFGEIENYNSLENFVICPDEVDFLHPDNCVMKAEFLQILAQKKTVTEAIEQGLIDGSTPFISLNDPRNNSDTCYREGLCYHNLIKLREAGVVSVGWELAAERSPTGRAVTLQQAIDCFEDAPSSPCVFATSPDYDDHNPYYHLVDPDWVLKNPPARCNALVYAPTLESSQTSSRQEYCADVETCLAEDDQGNCIDGQYGYCTRSENIWRLNGDICEDGEIYSGCLTFDNDGLGEASYLEQTLDYCTVDQAGCLRYSQEKNVDNAWVLDDIAVDDNDLFLNNQSSSCPSDQAGCNEYIVMATGLGINLLDNGDFNYYTGDIDDGVSDIINGWTSPNMQIVSDAYYGATAASFQNSISTTFDTGLALANRTFAVSFFGKASSANNYTLKTKVDGVDSSSELFDITPNWAWEEFKFSFDPDEEHTSFTVLINGPGAIIDSVKLEEVLNSSASATAYTTYGDGGRIFMDDSRNMCLAEEVGCQGYLPDNGDPMIPAMISVNDICPAECVGYSSFTQRPDTFDILEGLIDPEYYNFIPTTAHSCPSIAIGCEEFTNLDEIAEGGEGKEYYTYLRQCVPMDAGNIETYFTWEGQDVVGYQLKTWTTLRSNLSAAPCTNVSPGSNTCIDTAFNDDSFWDDYEVRACGPETPDPFDGPEFNPNCREFFDVAGNPHYRLQDRVVFASDDCHDYRRSATGQQYQAIPSLSFSCAAQFDGCKSYTGNAANNVRQIFIDNFESGSYVPWAGAGLDISNQSMANNGHSLKANANTTISRGLTGLQTNQSYQISWWMKNSGNLDDVIVTLSDGTDIFDIGNTGVISFGDWRRYELTASEIFNIDIDGSLELRIEFIGNGEVFLDNVILKEVIDSLSFVKNSWNTPIQCDTPFEGAYLGCQSYTDTNGIDYNLKSFSNLCREQSIGCMAVIDTNNTSNPFSETFNESYCSNLIFNTEASCNLNGETWTDEYSEITIASDSIDYLVPNPNNYCPQAYKGCSALGLPSVDQATDSITGFSTVYKMNDPDNYQNILCAADALYCEAYSSDKGNYYFRDPGSRTCVYREQVNMSIGLISGLFSGWFVSDSLDTDTPVGCSDNGDAAYSSADFQLPTDWAAACPAHKNLCTEYRDPADPATCDVNVAGSCQSYYYYNNDKIDQSSCNGQVDRNSGCVLLYETNDWNAQHTFVNAEYDANATYDQNILDNAPVNPLPGDNSNILVKVAKDRQCAEWLSCKSSTAVFDPNTASYKVICDALDSCIGYGDNNNITQCAEWGSNTDTTPLTFEEYQSRATGVNDHLQWSDQDYLGYSTPNSLPVKDLVVYNFSTTTEPDPRLVYESEDEAECESRPNGAVCHADVGDENMAGTCQDEICWINPILGKDALGVNTRGYAAQNAPFAHNIDVNRSADPLPYSQANICEDGDNSCEIQYKKVTYGLGGVTKYYSDSFAPGACISVSGEEIPDDEAYNDNGTYITKPFEGSPCLTNDNCGGRENGGRCQDANKIETFMNWPGVCLEYDRSTPVLMDGAGDELAEKYYCNQWYPVDEVQGAQSLYNNFTEAGFYSDTGADVQMCAVGEAYSTLEDRYYCVKEEDTYGFCSILAKVPAGSKFVTSLVEANADLLVGKYLKSDPPAFTIELVGGEDIIVRVGANDCGYGDADENEDRNDQDECFGDASVFIFSDFKDATNMASILITREQLENLFDAGDIAADIEYFYFDEEIDSDGDRLDHSGVLAGAFGDDNNVPANVDPFNEWSYNYHSRCGRDIHNDECPAGMHQIYVRSWHGGSHCSLFGPRHHRSYRFCNPLTYNYYAKAEITPNLNCTDTNCSGPSKGRACLGAGAPYNTITPFASSAWGDPNICNNGIGLNATTTDVIDKCFKTCVERITVNEDMDHSCSIYGDTVGDPVNDLTGCYAALYDVDDGIIASLALEQQAIGVAPHYNGCLSSNVPLCAAVVDPSFYQNSSGTDCGDATGCYQQCAMVTSIGAEGDRDKSWVRTDIWWRAKQEPSSYHNVVGGNTWNARYYAGPNYITEQGIYFNKINAADSNAYFGSMSGSLNVNQPLLTQIPLNFDPNAASIFFGVPQAADPWADGRGRLKWLLAKFYNFQWDSIDSEYDEIGFDGSTYTNNDYNPDAGADYDPYIYQVCGNVLCDGGNEGITINNANTGDVVSHGDLFTAIKFYYHAHPDHMPIISVEFDPEGNGFIAPTLGKYKNNMPECKPGDTVPSGEGELGFGGLARACHTGYKTFYSTYSFDDDGVNNYLCDGTDGSPVIENASCYQPQVRVTDNWGKDTIQVYSDWVVIYQD
jgi:hypothetical protein